jgi:hypothetical protein
MGIKFGEKIQVVPLYAPVETTESKETACVALENAQWVTFLVMTGALATDSDDQYEITVKSAATNSTGAADVAIPYKYRLSSAVGTDSWGAITSATSTGFILEATTDGAKAVLIDVDPASIPALDSDALYVYVDIATTTMVSGPVAVSAYIEPRYPQNSNLSSS